MGISMESNAERAKADRKKVKKLRQPPPDGKRRYVIIDKRFHARYYFDNFRIFKKRLDAFRLAFPKEFKKRFETQRNTGKKKQN